MEAEIFQKADCHIPQRFWEYAIRTEYKHSRFYDSLGFTYSEKHTKEYNKLSDKDKNNIRFAYVNGKKQY